MADSNTISNFNNMATVKSVGLSSATENGTKIVKQSNGMDKNAFLKILVAELSNQDPTQAKDSTEYVAQLAQFSSLEQMANLNTTMSFNAASNMVGKTVGLDIAASDGNLLSGVVKNAVRSGDNIKLTVETRDGETQVALSDVLGVQNTNNTDIGSAVNLIGKNIRIYSNDGTNTIYTGSVKSVSNYTDGIALKIAVNNTEIDTPLTIVSGTSDKNDPSAKGIYTGTSDKSMQIRYNNKSNSYEYKYADSTDWNSVSGNSFTADGINYSLPRLSPMEDCLWGINLKVPSKTQETKELPLSNVVEVLG